MHVVQQRHPRVRAHHQPGSLADALALLHDLGPRGRAIAGGTDLILDLERGVRRGIEELVDLTRIPGLAEIVATDGELVLGPLVTHNDVIADPRVVADALPLAQACLEVGAPALRNRATIAGNIVTASPANDTLSALIALDASVTIQSAAGPGRRVSVVDFVTGFRTVDLGPGELVTAIHVPTLGPTWRGVFVKLGLRKAQAISVVHLALVLDEDGGEVTDCRLALGSVAPTVVRAPDVEAAVTGSTLDGDAIEAAARAARAMVRPIDDVRATAEYRSEQVGVMVRRALLALRDGTERSRWPARPAPLHRRLVSRGDAATAAVTVNGRTVRASPAPGVTLLEWLRDTGHTSTKEGCAEGECGACMVTLDGVAVLACLVHATRAAGTQVVTVEGLGADGLHPLQAAFVARGAVQCGYCTPGFLVAGAELLATCPQPDTEEIRRGLAGNLCRCTGYYSIVDAVHDAAVSIAGASR